MKPSSSDEPVPAFPAPAAPAPSEPVVAFPAPRAAPDAGAVVPARLDRPLAAGALGHGWAHPQIEQQIARARATAAEAARSEGYAAGWAQGRRAAAEAAQAEALRREADAARQAQAAAVRVEQLVNGLADALRAADVAAAPAWEEVGDTIVDCALGIARAVLARELRSVDAAVVEALRTAVRCLGEPDELTVTANPADVEVLSGVTASGLPRALRFVPDPGVPAGTLTARTLTQRVTVDVPAALAAAEEVLRG